MASSVVIMGGDLAVTSARYFPVGNGRCNFNYFTLDSVEFPWPFTCTFKKLRVSIPVNTRTGRTSGTLGPVLYVNGSPTSFLVDFADGATGNFANNIDTVSITAGDLVGWRDLLGSGGSGGYDIRNVAFECETAGSDAPNLHMSYVGTANMANLTTYAAIVVGSTTFTATESNHVLDSAAGVWSEMSGLVRTNTRNGDSSVTLRKNSADATSTYTIPATTTGYFTDSSNTDSFALGDDVTLKAIRGGSSGNVNVVHYNSVLTCSDSKFMSFAYGISTWSPGSASDYYFQIGGLISNDQTESGAQISWPASGLKAVRIELDVSTNTVASDSTIALAINGSDTGLTVTIPASTTGRYVATVDAAISDGDLVCCHIHTGGSGSFAVQGMGLIFAPDAPSGPTIRYVNAASTGGDGTTNATSGSAAAYALLSAAITAEAATTGELTIYCEGATIDTGGAYFTGMSASSIVVQGDGDYQLTSSGYYPTFRVLSQNNITVRDLKIDRTGSGVQIRAMQILGAGGTLLFEGNTFTHGSITKDGNNELVWIAPATSANVTFRNNFLDSSLWDGLHVSTEGSETYHIYNNTIVDSAETGFIIDVGNVQATDVSIINNLVVGSGTADYSFGITPTGTYTRTTNASSDTTSPNDTWDSVTVTFATAPALDSGDTDVIDQGTTIGSFSDDIFGVSRPQGAAWDIGCAEFEGGSSSIVILRRRRN